VLNNRSRFVLATYKVTKEEYREFFNSGPVQPLSMKATDDNERSPHDKLLDGLQDDVGPRGRQSFGLEGLQNLNQLRLVPQN